MAVNKFSVGSSFEPFDNTTEPWNLYAERLDLYLQANDVTDERRKVTIFLTLLGAKTYALVRSLVSPSKPSDRTYKELVSLLQNHFNPPPSQVMERISFSKRDRLPEESISTYIAQLRKAAEHCNFKENLDMMLRDRFVAGIQDQSIQMKFINEPAADLTLKRALEIALTMESAAKNMQDLGRGETMRDGSQTVQRLSLGLGQNMRRASSSWAAKEGTRSGNECYRCGSQDHRANSCRFRATICNYCHKVGHLERVCNSAKRDGRGNGRVMRQASNKANKVNSLDVETLSTESHETETGNLTYLSSEYDIFKLSSLEASSALSPAPKPYYFEFLVNGTRIQMEHDSGAAYSVISAAAYNDLKGRVKMPDIKPSPTTLRAYNRMPVPVEGFILVVVEFQGVELKLPLLIISDSLPSLCGRNWINAFNLVPPQVMCSSINNLTSNSRLKAMLARYADLFSPGLGLLRNVQVHLHQRPDYVPKIYKPRPVPFAVRNKVEEELERLQLEGIIEPVKIAQSAAPVVPILKSNNKNRICGAFNLTANKATVTEQYPLPKFNELFATLSGGKYFTKLDLRDAYNQLQLDEESRNLVVITTTKGLFRYTRLPFGVSSAPAIFQQEMERILVNIPHVAIFQDDLLVTGVDDEDHFQNLDAVLSQLSAVGLKLRKEKCAFMAKSVEYLGHRLDSRGLLPSDKNLQPILEAPAPVNVSELRSFLGLITYYSKFIPCMSDLLHPLYRLMHKNHPWVWNSETEEAFRKAKETLTSSKVLVHYDPVKPIVLACDASPVGIGAVLSHMEEDGSDRPILFASRTLSSAEKNYSQIEKEALSLVFGVTRFRQYLLGRHFTLLTDHSPLATLLASDKLVPMTTAARIQRWAITLSAYDYTLKYRPGSKNANADALSRLPIPQTSLDPPLPQEYVMMLEASDIGPVTAKKLRNALQLSKSIKQLINFIQNGWPKDQVSDALQAFKNKKDELTVVSGLIIWHNRVFIPELYRHEVLEELNEGHLGITKTKRMARSVVWWPNIDTDVENLVNACPTCQQNAALPPQKTTHWPKPTYPMDRVHIDYLGPVEKRMVFVFLDTYSNWIEAVPTDSITSFTTVEILRDIFSRYGLPNSLVSDNGTNFTSSEFKRFITENGIKHLLIAPRHPSSNGPAEKAVSTVKHGLAKVQGGTMKSRLARILFSHRRSPSETGGTPASLFLGRQLRSRLDALRPFRSLDNPPLVKLSLNSDYKDGDMVWAKNYGIGPNWYEGRVVKLISNAMLEISTPEGSIRRHVNQVRRRHKDESSDEVISAVPSLKDNHIATEGIPSAVAVTSAEDIQTIPGSPVPSVPLIEEPRQEAGFPVSDLEGAAAGVLGNHSGQVRRSSRISKKPVRLSYDKM